MVNLKFSSLMSNEKGFTLLELVIVITIFSIVILIGASMFVYAMINYRNAIEQQNEQFNVRLVSDLITTDIRNSLEIQEVDQYVTDCIEYSMYVNSADDNFYRYNSATGVNQLLTQGYVDYINVSIVEDSGLYYVDYSVMGINGYEIESRVLLNNISSNPDPDASDNLNVLTYRKP